MKKKKTCWTCLLILGYINNSKILNGTIFHKWIEPKVLILTIETETNLHTFY